MSDVVDQIIKAKTASIDLSVLSTEVKDAALRAMAGALNARRSEILDANVLKLILEIDIVFVGFELGISFGDGK